MSDATDSSEPQAAEETGDSAEMPLESLEQRIQEAEELHRTLTRRLDETARD